MSVSEHNVAMTDVDTRVHGDKSNGGQFTRFRGDEFFGIEGYDPGWAAQWSSERSVLDLLKQSSDLTAHDQPVEILLARKAFSLNRIASLKREVVDMDQLAHFSERRLASVQFMKLSYENATFTWKPRQQIFTDGFRFPETSIGLKTRHDDDKELALEYLERSATPLAREFGKTAINRFFD